MLLRVLTRSIRTGFIRSAQPLPTTFSMTPVTLASPRMFANAEILAKKDKGEKGGKKPKQEGEAKKEKPAGEAPKKK